MLRETVSTNGSLEKDNLERALLTHHNTPNRDTGLSRAQVIFGHPIRESFLIKPNPYTPRKERLLTRDMMALTRRHAKQEDNLTEHTKVPPGLKISNVALV